jgi:hypothetical protein
VRNTQTDWVLFHCTASGRAWDQVSPKNYGRWLDKNAAYDVRKAVDDEERGDAEERA